MDKLYNVVVSIANTGNFMVVNNEDGTVKFTEEDATKAVDGMTQAPWFSVLVRNDRNKDLYIGVNVDIKKQTMVYYQEAE